MEDRDLAAEEDVAELVRRFYRDVAQDDLLGPLFNDVAGVDWNEHLPKLTSFWCRFLFGRSGYEGNPYRRHQLVHDRSPFGVEHFHRWLDLFEATLDDGWSGPNVERARAFAARVAGVHGKQLAGVDVRRERTGTG